MKALAMRTLAFMLIIGGLIGIGIVVYMGYTVLKQHWLYSVMVIIFLIVFSYSFITGVRLWKNDPRGHKWAMILFATQIPVFTLPGITYEWYTAFAMKVMGGKVEKNFVTELGSSINLYLDIRITDVAYGVNLVALAAFLFLFATRANPSFKRDA